MNNMFIQPEKMEDGWQCKICKTPAIHLYKKTEFSDHPDIFIHAFNGFRECPKEALEFKCSCGWEGRSSSALTVGFCPKCHEEIGE